MADVVLNKIQTIQKCLARIQEEYIGYEDSFKTNYTKQDSVILNLERASQATIDIATHIIKVKKLGLPNSSRELFDILLEYGYISDNIANQMKGMVGFRNIAVHDYQNLNIDIVITVIEKHLIDFEKYIEEIISNYIRGYTIAHSNHNNN